MSDQDISWDELHPATQRLLSRRSFLTTAGTGAAVTFLGFTVVGCSSNSTATGATTTTAAGGAGTTTTAKGATAATAGGAKGTAAAGSLYTKLGGNPAITAVVAAFVKNVGGDARINQFFAKTNLERLQVLLVEQISEATGGPEKYTGRDMKTTHAGLKITAAHFNALVEDLTAAMNQYQVPQADQDAILSKLAPMRPDIVTA